MKVSLSWLKELVDFTENPEDLADKLSLSSIGVKQQTGDYLELDLTYNRGDLLSLRGVAYEVSGITNSPLKFLSPPPEDFIWVGKTLGKTPVEIEDQELSQVQCVAKIEGLKVGPSSKEAIKKLTDSGMRSVNNLVDVTNLIMLEFGQPLHAFDKRDVADETINVRRAKEMEEITTLDNKLRKLNSSDIVLADTKKPLDVAGVMGGKNTEVKDDTETILLSASMFNSIMVRKTSKRLGLYSEASKRFQHGLSAMRLLQAMDAAIKMYQDLGGKLTAINMKGDFNQPKKTIDLSIKKTNDLLGVKLDKETITACLQKLNFSVVEKGENLEVIPPYFRLDINIEEDVIEEVARMYGYEKIEGEALEGEEPDKLDQSLQEAIQSLKIALKEIGLTEVQTYSFYSTAVLEALRPKDGRVGFTDQYEKFLIKIANPISAETEYLRMNVWPNLVEVIGKNLRNGFSDIAIFEIGKSYPLDGEGYVLAIALCNGSDNPMEELMAIVDKLGLDLKQNQSPSPKVVADLFHPKRFVHFEKDGKEVGGASEVHLRVLDKLGIDKRVAVLEIGIEPDGK